MADLHPPLELQLSGDLVGTPFPPVRTLTYHNGREFDERQTIATTLLTEVYFTHPYAPCELGLNEHTKGLGPHYFPKDAGFTTVTDEATPMLCKG